jgi:hypothetical protein
MQWQFYCSWPDGSLNPNSRIHWSVKGRARKEQREEACILARQSVPPASRQKLKELGALRLRLQFVRPNRRWVDIDNLIAASKGLIDGVADAVGLDDRYFKMEFEIDDPPMKPGGVRVTVSEYQGASRFETEGAAA